MTTQTNKKDSWKVLAVMLTAAFAVSVIPSISFADYGTDVFGTTLCKITKWFTGSTGKAIATIAVIFLGIAAFFGKVTWGLALMFAVGIFAIFGAAEIVEAVGGDNATGGCGTSNS